MKAEYYFQPTHLYPILVPLGSSGDESQGQASYLSSTRSRNCENGNDCVHVKVRASGQCVPPKSWNAHKYSVDKKTGLTVYKIAGKRTFGVASGSFSYNNGMSQISFGPGHSDATFISKDGKRWFARVQHFTYDIVDGKLRLENHNYCSQKSDNESASEALSSLKLEHESVSYQSLMKLNLSPQSNFPAREYAMSYCQNLAAIVSFDRDRISRRFFVPLSELANEAASNADFDRTNAIGLVKDVLTIGKDISNWPELVDSLFKSKSVKEFLASSSDIYLSGKYGLRMTYADLGLVSDAWVQKPRAQTTSASSAEEVVIAGHIFSGECRLSFDWLWTGFNKLYAYMASKSLEIRAADLWDLVPYSFVVDWFAGIGDLLDCWDNQRRVDKMDVYNIWYTHKWKGNIPIDNKKWKGNLNVTIFLRDGLSQLPPLSPGSTEPTAHDHLAEGSALFIQRVTH